MIIIITLILPNNRLILNDTVEILVQFLIEMCNWSEQKLYNLTHPPKVGTPVYSFCGILQIPRNS